MSRNHGYCSLETNNMRILTIFCARDKINACPRNFLLQFVSFLVSNRRVDGNLRN